MLFDFIFQLASIPGLSIKCPFIKVKSNFLGTSGVYSRSIKYAFDEPDNPVWEHSEGYDRYIFKVIHLIQTLPFAAHFSKTF